MVAAVAAKNEVRATNSASCRSFESRCFISTLNESVYILFSICNLFTLVCRGDAKALNGDKST